MAFKGFLAPAWSPELVCVRIQGDITPEAEDDFQESMLELDQHLRDRAAEHREDRTCSRQCLRKLRLYFRFLHVIRQAHKKRARWRFIRNKQPPVGQQADSSQLVGANQKQRYALRHPQLRAGQMSNVFGGGGWLLSVAFSKDLPPAAVLLNCFQLPSPSRPTTMPWFVWTSAFRLVASDNTLLSRCRRCLLFEEGAAETSAGTRCRTVGTSHLCVLQSCQGSRTSKPPGCGLSSSGQCLGKCTAPRLLRAEVP